MFKSPGIRCYTPKGLIFSDIWARRFKPATAGYPSHFSQINNTMATDVCLEKYSPHCAMWTKPNTADLYWRRKKSIFFNLSFPFPGGGWIQGSPGDSSARGRRGLVIQLLHILSERLGVQLEIHKHSPTFRQASFIYYQVFDECIFVWIPFQRFFCDHIFYYLGLNNLH